MPVILFLKHDSVCNPDKHIATEWESEDCVSIHRDVAGCSALYAVCCPCSLSGLLLSDLLG